MGLANPHANSSLPSIHQPINPSTHPSINPSIHQPINPSTHQSINPSIHQSINPSTHQPINSINTSTHQSINPPSLPFPPFPSLPFLSTTCTYLCHPQLSHELLLTYKCLPTPLIPKAPPSIREYDPSWKRH